jgi:CelD/BcsL family acetyltransferase involved in cellulose biosynthesis
MSASTDPTQSPEWEQARKDWYEQARAQLTQLQTAVTGATPGSLALETIYAPMHDMAGLAGVFNYDLLGKIARGLIETLRKGANPLDEKMLMVARAHLAALVALHAKDVRGAGGPQGVAILAKLASIHA